MQVSTVKKILVANLIAQSAIIVTGATVRLTGSGLGCPTWPQCTPGSFIPTLHQAEGYHKYIEYGNRTLTGVLSVVAVLTVWAIFTSTSDARLRRLATIPFIGTIIQALIGGITVLTDLHSGVVLVHLLVSMWLVGVSVYLLDNFPDVANRKPQSIGTITGALVMGTAAAIVFLGSVVTNSGPHSGDADVASALPFDPALMAWLHADVVWLFVGLIIASWLLLRARVLDTTAEKPLRVLTGLTIVQGVVGYTQYFTGLPILLVGIHVTLAVLIWIAAIYFSRRARFVA